MPGKRHKEKVPVKLWLWKSDKAVVKRAIELGVAKDMTDFFTLAIAAERRRQERLKDENH